MLVFNKLKNRAISGTLLLALASVSAFAATASAQTRLNPFGASWLGVGSVQYPGGTWAIRLPVAAPVESSEIGVAAPQFCAPRAAASRVVVTYDDGFGETQRLADLRFLAQDTWAGVIRARYRVVLPFGQSIPATVDEIRFTFVPVAGRSQPCRLDFYLRLD